MPAKKKSKARKSARVTRKSSAASNADKCPKCGSVMVNNVCTKCKYSPKTAYRSRAEAKEFTVAGD